MIRSPFHRMGAVVAVVGALTLAPLTVAGGATPSAASLLKSVLARAARENSFTLSGVGTVSGLPISMNVKVSDRASFTKLVVTDVGIQYEAQSTVGQQVFVKGSTLAALHDFLSVKSPTPSEVGVWYFVTPSDKRYSSFDSNTGAQTIKQQFSIGAVGFSPKASIVHVTALRGVKVVELRTLSNMWASGTSLIPQMLYVTDTARPTLFATSGPSGIKGVFYFGSWNHTTIRLPTASQALPA